jgi:hypothetical protein
MTLAFARAFAAREEGRVFEALLLEQMREEREELWRRIEAFDRRNRSQGA